MDISIGPTGEELPPGRGTAKEGAQVFARRGARDAMAPAGIGGLAPELQSKKGQDVPHLGTGAHPAAARAVCDDGLGLHQSRHACSNEGTLTADEVYALTAYLLFINKVIPEDEVLDQQSLPKVKMPIGDDYGKLPEWKPRTPRLEGYPY